MTSDRFGNLLTVTDALGQRETYEYDITGRPAAKTDRNGNRTELEHAAAGRLVKQRVSANGIDTEKSTAYYRNGPKKSEHVRETRAGKVLADLTIRCAYDACGRLAVQYDPEGVEKHYTYNENGQRIGFVLNRRGTNEIALWYTYDSLNRLMEVRRDSDAGDVVAAYEYNANGDRTRQYYPANGVEALYLYNRAGLVTELANYKRGVAVSRFQYTYTTDGNQLSKTDLVGNTVHYEYDRLGRLIRESDATWNTIAYRFDRFSNRSAMTVTGLDRYETTYAYDWNNRLLEEVKQSKDGQEILRYRYDANGNQIRCERETLQRRTPQNARPEQLRFVKTGGGKGFTLETRLGNKNELRTGLDHTGAAPAVTRYTYDRFGNLLTVTDALGQRETYEYDITGRPTAKTDRNGNRAELEHDAASSRIPHWRRPAGLVPEPNRQRRLLGRRRGAEHRARDQRQRRDEGDLPSRHCADRAAHRRERVLRSLQRARRRPARTASSRGTLSICW